MEEYFEIGQIVNTNGLKGTLKVKPLTDDITRFEELETVYIQKAKELVEFKIQDVKYSKNMVLLKLEGIDDINEAVIKLTGDNVFSLIDAIVAKNKRKAYLITQELIDKGEDISKIIIMVADQFRLMYQVKNFLKEGYSKEDIASLLKIHPYRVKLAIEKGYNYSSKVLLTNLEYFYDLDYMIKSGSNNPKLCFELFLAKL